MVMVKGRFSRKIFVKSGVQQSSRLGPILFALYRNDIPNIICSSEILMYVDDAKLFLALLV